MLIARIASRDSMLALQQTQYVADQLSMNIDKFQYSIIKMKTQGDKILDIPLSKIGGKSLFMKELEVAMIDNKADFAVHSLKDIPYKLPNQFVLAAFCKREDPRDAFVSNKYSKIKDLPFGSTIGTSSLRRKAQILSIRNDLIVKDIRGNLQTRLKKLDSGEYSAIILAAAGLIRLNLKDRISQYMSIDTFVPAVGQGIISIECLKEDKLLIDKLKVINHQESFLCAQAERAFNKELQGGCHMPIAGYAEFKDGYIHLRAMVASSDGVNVLYHNKKGTDPLSLGKEVAIEMISKGAHKILGIE